MAIGIGDCTVLAAAIAASIVEVRMRLHRRAETEAEQRP